MIVKKNIFIRKLVLYRSQNMMGPEDNLGGTFVYLCVFAHATIVFLGVHILSCFYHIILG